MNPEELEAYVVERLGAGVANDDVILEVTQRSGLSWPEAEDLVRRTADLRGPSVARRQFPLLAFLAAAVMVGGLALLVACALSFSDALLLLKPVRGDADQGRVAAFLALLAANGPILSLIPLGAGMILGGALGLARALQATEPTD
jgi:hypothetical protein